MKKNLYVILTIILLISTHTLKVSANYNETYKVDKIYKSDVIPNKMGSKSVIEFISDSEFLLIDGEVVQGYNENVFENIKRIPGVIYEDYPNPVAGLKVTYTDDGHLLDLIYPDHIENPLLKESNIISTPHIENNLGFRAQNIGGYPCDSFSLLAQWGGYPNKLYNCTNIQPICRSSESNVDVTKNNYSVDCSTTVYSRIGIGQATTFSDQIGQANIKLKKGDVATKLAFDNVSVGKVISVTTKTKLGVNKTVNMTKNDAGGMPNAVLDIWKTGVEYWGYNWSSTFSMPNTTTYQYRR